MPRNRQTVPRHEREAEILDVASEMFASRGYAETSVSEVARELGSSPGNVHWYYPSKDDLFAAVVDRWLDQNTAAIEARTDLADDPLGRFFAMVDTLVHYRAIRDDIIERAPHSEAVASVDHRQRAWFRAALDEVLDVYLRPGEYRDMAVHTIGATALGATIRPNQEPPTAEILRFALERIVRDAPELHRAPGAPTRREFGSTLTWS